MLGLRPRLLRPLYQRGLTAEEVRKLFRVLDWMMQLPEDIELEFQQQLEQFERENSVPYITSIERMATQKAEKKAGKKAEKKAEKKAGRKVERKAY